jgi:hypothetical protein
MAQIGDGKLAYRLQIVGLARRGKFTVVRLHRFAGQEIRRDIRDVVAVVGGGRPLGITGFHAASSCLHAVGQCLDLHAGVVVIKLAADLPALCRIQVAYGVTERRLAAMPHMQRAGRIGGNELDQHLVALAGVTVAECIARRADLRHDAVPSSGCQVKIDETGAGNFGLGYQRRSGQLGQDALRQLAWIAFQRTCQLHRCIAGKIAVGGVFRTLDLEAHRGVGRHRFEGLADQEGDLFFKRMDVGHDYKEEGKVHILSVRIG